MHRIRSKMKVNRMCSVQLASCGFSVPTALIQIDSLHRHEPHIHVHKSTCRCKSYGEYESRYYIIYFFASIYLADGNGRETKVASMYS